MLLLLLLYLLLSFNAIRLRMTLNTQSIPRSSPICLICVVVGCATADYRVIPKLAVPPQQPDVPACHVHGQTLRYHEPQSNATPKTWDDALRVPLAVWAGDCLSASDDHVRQAGEALTRRRVDSATCCCASWNAKLVEIAPLPRTAETIESASRDAKTVTWYTKLTVAWSVWSPGSSSSSACF